MLRQMGPTKVLDASGLSSLELMRLHVHACYVHDDGERLLYVNEPYGKSAPRFWLGRTKEGAIWRFGKDFPVDLVENFTRLCESEPAVSDLSSAPRHRSSYESLMGSTEPAMVTSGPTYWIRDRTNIASTAVEVTSAQALLLRGTLDDWIPDLEFRRPFFASIAASKAVAVCASVRIGGRADEAGVETAPAFRRQGHAANAVSAWAAAVLAVGKVPLYSTSWENAASQRVARSTGFELFGAEYSIQ